MHSQGAVRELPVLRRLDLSGNGLGSAGCLTVVEAVAYRNLPLPTVTYRYLPLQVPHSRRGRV